MWNTEMLLHMFIISSMDLLFRLLYTLLAFVPVLKLAGVQAYRSCTYEVLIYGYQSDVPFDRTHFTVLL